MLPGEVAGDPVTSVITVRAAVMFSECALVAASGLQQWRLVARFAGQSYSSPCFRHPDLKPAVMNAAMQ